MIGKVVSHYRILDKLGEGGMGVVYRARDEKLDRFVALKFLPRQLSANEAEHQRFLQEAKTAAALSHPNVCVIHAIDQSDGHEFIAMEFVEGATVKSLIAERTLSLEDIIRIGAQTAEGLSAAHANGIVHRDVKSDNLMVTKDRRVKIMDFGLAKLRGGLQLTRAGTTVGTAGYMSPEQIQGDDVGPASDLWSLGVVLYEMLTGQLPFRGEHEAAIIYEILNVDPPSVLLRRPDTPPPLLTLVGELLQKNPHARPRSAREVAERLRNPVPKASRPGERSIAVLYFENMSPEKESEYFCAGMTEDIITDLSRIRELKVVPRTDVQAFRNKEINTRRVGEALNVNYVLEGSVRKSGNKMRITAQLIDVATGFHIWADRFDRLVEDIFDVQTEVSQRIADALKISLTEAELQSITRKPTQDLRAYDFYMRGRDLLSRRGKKNTEMAIRMFEDAIALDPRFAGALASLAEAFSSMHSWYDGSPEWLTKAYEVAARALAIDSQSLEAQFTVGMVRFHEKQYSLAVDLWRQVIRQDPDFYDAHRWLGMTSDIAGDYDEALRCYRECVRIKPFSEEPWLHIYLTYARKGDSAASLQAKRTLLELGARRLMINPEDAIVLSRMAAPYADLGERDKAYAALQKVLEIDSTDGLLQYNCACTYAVLGEKGKALACLRTALNSGYRVHQWVGVDPDLKTLYDDPEFQTLLSEIK